MQLPKELTTITPVSRFLAVAVFLTTPFIAFFTGIRYEEMITPFNLADYSSDYSVVYQKPPRPITKELTKGSMSTYTSPDIGITFNYDTNQLKSSNLTANVKQEHSKIYVYYTAPGQGEEQAIKGQYVEVYKKDPLKTLEQAVKENFLPQSLAKFCSVTKNDSYHKKEYPENYETAVINFKISEDPNNLYKYASKCPMASAGSDIFFLMDKNKPEKFAAFVIGQYSIFANQQTPWQFTFKFL